MVEDGDAEYPLTVDPAWTELQALAASDGASDDHFGFSVAVSGNTAVIGAIGRNSSLTARHTCLCAAAEPGRWG